MKSLSGRKNLLEQSAFGFTNSLMYSLEESRKLRILITWVLILPSNLIALWRCSYLVSKTIFILSSYVEVYVIKKIQVWTLCLWLVSRPPKSGCFFGKFFVELFCKSLSGKNSSPEHLAFWFSNSLPYGLEESREFRDLIRWVFDIQKCKKCSADTLFRISTSRNIKL